MAQARRRAEGSRRRGAIGVALLAGCGRFGYDLLGVIDGPGGGRAGSGAGGSSFAGSGDAGVTAGSGGFEGGRAGASSSGAGGSTASAGSSGSSPVADAGSRAGEAGALDAGTSGEERCADGVQGPDETGVDCGGSCAPCACAFGVPELLGDPNYAGNQLYSPTLSPDGLQLFFGLIVPGFAEQVGAAERSDPNGAFGLGEVVGPPITTSVEGNPHFGPGGLSLLFYSERSGTGAQELFAATRAALSDSFATASALTALNSSGLDQVPWISADDLRVYFVSDRGGDRDIWFAERATPSDAFETPVPVDALNSDSPEGKATLSPDELQVVFSSDRGEGLGGTDFYIATRASADLPFSAPLLLEALSTAEPEYDAEWTRDGQWLYFASTRGGGDSRLWRSAVTCP